MHALHLLGILNTIRILQSHLATKIQSELALQSLLFRPISHISHTSCHDFVTSISLLGPQYSHSIICIVHLLSNKHRSLE